ncbi:MAG: ornithine carbamoyltransferase [Bacillus sp. (in: Bacteria)]|nr:ornithine carbamoyltransferase [Bacillus sp. (in: firmicutes)]
MSQVDVQPALYGKDFLSLKDFSIHEIAYLIEKAEEMKQNPYQDLFKGKTLAMIFEKSSTRTRVSFEAGMMQLGGQAIFLSSRDIQLGRGETIADTARVLSGYLDGIMIRTFSHDSVEELAKYASIPVINGLTDLHHPCQVLADLQTILEIKGTLKGQKLVYIGDGNNMAHSLMIGAAKTGMEMVVAAPEKYLPDEKVTNKAQEIANETGAKISVTTDAAEAVQNADFIYTDVWASMGQEEEQEVRKAIFAEYQVNDELLAKAKSDVTFLHCLPAHRGEEVTESVLEGKHSVVFQQAENRLHAQKALLTALMS